MLLRKLLDKPASALLFEALSRIYRVKPWLGVLDLEGRPVICYPEAVEQDTMEDSQPPDDRRQQSYPTATGYIDSPLFIDDVCIGNLVGKSNKPRDTSFPLMLELLNSLLVSQIKNKKERKEILRETLDTYKEINLLYNLGDSISSCLDIEQLAKTILRESQKIIKSKSSSLMLLEDETDRLEIKAALGDKNRHRLELRLGRGIAGIVARDTKYIISNDVSQYSRFIPGKKHIRSLLCVPLKTKRKVLGVINLSNKLDGKMFTARDAKLLSAVAFHAANFIENAILYKRKLNKDRLKRNLERYISPHIVKDLLEGHRELELGGVSKQVVVLFADIRQFTSLSEELEPTRLVSFLNEFFTSMVDIIFKYGGMIDKFVGDEIMAIFGAPVSHPDDASRAIQTAIKMQQATQNLKPLNINHKIMSLAIGIGINSGEVIAGNIGSSKHMDYTVIGDVVNIAKRLESHAQKKQILVTRAVFNIIKDKHPLREIGKINIKGKKQPVEVFEIVY